MDTIRRNSHSTSQKGVRNVLVIGGDHFGLAVAEYLTEGAQSVTFVSETKLTDVADEVRPINRELSCADDVRSLASEITDIDLAVVVGSDSETLLLGYLIRRELDPCDVVASISNPANESAFDGTGVDCINIALLLAEQLCDRYE